MLYLFLVAGLFLLPMLLRLAIRLRLGIPILYALGMLTVFHSWYQTHTALADIIFFALVGLAALSWVATAARKVYVWLDERLAERAAARELANLLNISDNQLSYITNVDSGRGLIKCGSAIVPFMNSFPKNKLYQLMTTRPSETMAA